MFSQVELVALQVSAPMTQLEESVQLIEVAGSSLNTFIVLPKHNIKKIQSSDSNHSFLPYCTTYRGFEKHGPG